MCTSGLPRLRLVPGNPKHGRESDAFARIGGDEFVAILCDLDDIASCAPILARRLDAATQTVIIGDLELLVSSCLGVTYHPQEEEVYAEQIRQALVNREFVLYYQPKVNMRTGAIIGAEALIRWQHLLRGLLSPAVFLPVIEDHLLELELGEWVIDALLTMLKELVSESRESARRQTAE